VLAGYLAIAFLIAATDWILGFSIAELRTAREMPTYYFVVVLVTDSVYSVAGGYLCAKIARTAARSSTIGLMALGELIGAISTVYLWYTVPHWYSFVLLILYPPLVWLGSWLRLRMAPVKPILVRVRARSA
jgi:hypothetical protein